MAKNNKSAEGGVREIWIRLMKNGSEKEPESKGIANKLSDEDIETILQTMEFFGIDENGLKQAYFDLKIPKYRVFDWLGMCLQGRCGIMEMPPENNVFVALATIYLNTNAVLQFINFLRYCDLQLWEGRFTSPELASYIAEWNKDDVANESNLGD
jgi:hypothetical protein